MSKICKFCGASLEDEAKFCDECGKKQDAIEENIQNEDSSNFVKEGDLNNFDIKTRKENRNKLSDKKKYILSFWAFLFGIASIFTFIFAPLVSIFLCLVGMILGIVSIKKEKRKLGIIGTIFSGVVIFLWIFIIIFFSKV